MFKWLWSTVDKELHEILGVFHSTLTELETFISKTKDIVEDKQNEIKTIMSEVELHKADITKAVTVANNLKKLLG